MVLGIMAQEPPGGDELEKLKQVANAQLAGLMTAVDRILVAYLESRKLI